VVRVALPHPRWTRRATSRRRRGFLDFRGQDVGRVVEDNSLKEFCVIENGNRLKFELWLGGIVVLLIGAVLTIVFNTQCVHADRLRALERVDAGRDQLLVSVLKTLDRIENQTSRNTEAMISSTRASEAAIRAVDSAIVMETKVLDILTRER